MIKKNNLKNGFFGRVAGCFILCFLLACVEPYEPATNTFESALVVEGIITSELKNQEIKLSKAYRLEENQSPYVNGAQVEILSSAGESFRFQYFGSGVYRSLVPFKAEEGVGYRLEIMIDEKLYESEEEKISGDTSLEAVTAEKAFNDEGQLGVAIYAETSTADSKFFRYTFEETYKIVSPYTATQKFIINESGLAVLVDVPEDEEREICYNTLRSKKGVLSDKRNLGDDNQRDLVSFIDLNERKIFTRYSILVKQNAISSEAFRFFETLEELSKSGNIFSQNQPGFLAGNIYQVNDPDAMVVGYFEVAREAEKRIFFNFEDIFSPDVKPDPEKGCVIVAPSPVQPGDIDTFVASGQLQYLGPAPPSGDPLKPNGPYYLVTTRCIDCKVLGTPEKPDFWIEDEE